MPSPRPRTRIYTPQDLCAGATHVFDREQAAYLTKVLRLKSGAEIGLFNARDGEWRAQLTIAGSRVASAIVGHKMMEPEKGQGPTLAFAPIKKTPLEWLMVKATELGVETLQPLLTDYTHADMPKADRLQSLLIEATEQCERCRIPHLAAPARLSDWLQQESPQSIWAALEVGEAKDVRDLAGTTAPGAILVGPEGGFSTQEIQTLTAHPGVIPIGLGPRILRAETAGLALLTLAQLAAGDFADRPPFRA